jgi:hypothetical protein
MKLKIILLFCLSLLVSSCATNTHGLTPTQKSQICGQLRQRIITNSDSTISQTQGGSPNLDVYSPTEAAMLYKQYDRYDCPENLDHTSY